MNWLVYDFGPNFGDNFRGFLFLKALKGRFPDIRMACWMTPDLYRGLGMLRKYLAFVDRFLVKERSPRETHLLNFALLKEFARERRDFVLENFPGGVGPDHQHYEKMIPNSEPWMTAKILGGEALDAPETVNQGEFLQRMLNVSAEDLWRAAPLFGRRKGAGRWICVGFCRPDERDRKQPSRAKISRIWERLGKWPGKIFALDRQDWYPLPPSPAVEDWRMKGWAEKVGILNGASLFIGIDGGLNHFAAACGCPTLSFYGEKHGKERGEKVGPYPRRTPFGEHLFFEDFEEFLGGIDRALSGRSKIGPESIGLEVFPAPRSLETGACGLGGKP